MGYTTRCGLCRSPVSLNKNVLDLSHVQCGTTVSVVGDTASTDVLLGVLHHRTGRVHIVRQLSDRRLRIVLQLSGRRWCVAWMCIVLHRRYFLSVSTGRACAWGQLGVMLGVSFLRLSSAGVLLVHRRSEPWPSTRLPRMQMGLR